MSLIQKENSNNIISSIQDYMFTSKNLTRYTKHMIQIDLKPKSSLKNIQRDKERYKDNDNDKNKNKDKDNDKKIVQKYNTEKCITEKKVIDSIYRPKQKDSLFWCFYILKNGYSNYEMEINNQYFTVEKTEKFKYIDTIRKNKDILKIHKIKPFTELEDDLANKERISIKTFFALCVLENINVLLVDKRKIFELTCADIDDKHPVNIVHRNNQTYEHHIELNVTNDNLQKYRETYYKLNNFDSTLKSMGSYKLEELIDLCKKLNINIETSVDKKKKTKKDIYELLVLNY